MPGLNGNKYPFSNSTRFRKFVSKKKNLFLNKLRNNLPSKFLLSKQT